MKVTRFDGTFELEWLTNDEAARGGGIGCVQIIDRHTGEVLAEAFKDDVLVRQSDGSIAVIRAIGKYEENPK